MSSPAAVVVSICPSCKRPEADAPVQQLLDEADQVRHRAPEAVQAPDDQGVAGLELLHARVEARAFRLGSGGVIGEHRSHPAAARGIELQLQVLRCSTHPGVADGSGSWISPREVEGRARKVPAPGRSSFETSAGAVQASAVRPQKLVPRRTRPWPGCPTTGSACQGSAMFLPPCPCLCPV